MMVNIVSYEMEQHIKIYKDMQQLAESLSAAFKSAADRAAEMKLNFTVALSGGNTPGLFLEKLASKNINWEYVHLFWSDERCVYPDHIDSNFRMTKQKLLDHISIPEQNIHNVSCQTSLLSEVDRYTKEILSVVPVTSNGYPQFDWILLGLGVDGHIASIFGGFEMFTAKKFICGIAIRYYDRQRRITLTMPVINNAKRIIFLVSGEDKAEIVSKVINKKGYYLAFPAAHVKPTDGILEWYLDEAAAAMLKDKQ